MEAKNKSSKKINFKIRRAHLGDLAKIVELNKKSYPQMAELSAVWGESHLKSHLIYFPSGQFVAEYQNKIIGLASSLIVNLGSDPFRNHTWSGITDSGYFSNHDPNGDTLYGADVCVDPSYRGAGIGARLYEARRRLCEELNLKRIVAGGRLWNYEEYRSQYTPQEYAQRVVSGEIKDLVLSFQLREGFILKGVMPNYISDPRSDNWASFLEWRNPKYKEFEADLPRKVRIACIQYKMRKVKSFADFSKQVEYFASVAADYKSDFVLFPELYTVQLLSQLDALSPQDGMKKLASYTNKIKKLMSKLSLKDNLTIIAGSHPTYINSKLENVSYICLPDGQIVEQSKIHITPNERKWWGINGGHHLQAIDTPKAKIGVLICYDVEFPEAVRHLVDQGIEILFVPFCTDNRHGYLRVRYCSQARAVENQIYVALAGNVGNLPSVENMDVQYAQAAVLTPCDFPFARDGIAAEADSNEETVLICDLDLDDLNHARNFGTVTPLLDRRPDLFAFESSLKKKNTFVAGEGPLANNRGWGED